jgi:hypothetical protein
MERWGEGEEMTAHDQSMAQVFADLMNLDYDRDVASFYETEEEEE